MRALANVLLGPGGQFHTLRDGPPERGHPEGLHRHPDFQGPEGAAQLQAAIRDVRVVRAPYRILEDVVVNPERALERACVLHQKTARLVGLEEPLVRVHSNRIGALHAAQEFLAPFGHDRKAAVGGVDMQPDSLRLAEIRHRLERVDRSRADRAGVSAYRDGIEPRRAIFGHGAHEGYHFQAKISVAREQPDALGPNTDDPRRADVRAVALVAHIDCRALGMARAFTRRDEGVQAGRRASAREKPARTLGIADPATQPVDDDQFDLTRAARHEPGGRVDVEARGQEVGQHPGPGRRRGYEPEGAGVVQAQREREDIARGPLENLRGRAALLGRSLQQLFLEFLLEIPVPSALPGQILGSLHQNFRRPARQIEHLLRRHPEIIAHCSRCFSSSFVIFHQASPIATERSGTRVEFKASTPNSSPLTSPTPEDRILGIRSYVIFFLCRTSKL